MTVTLTNPASRFAVRFLQEIESIPYAVLRNYEGLPEFPGNDLDMVARKSDLPVIANTVYKCARLENWKVIQEKVFQEHYLFVLQKADAGCTVFYQVDVWTGFSWRGYFWFNSLKILERRRRRGTIWIPTPADEAAVTLMYKMIESGALPERYQISLQCFVSEQPGALADNLSSLISRDLPEKIEMAIRDGELKQLNSYFKQVRKELIQYYWTTSPLRQVFRLAGFWLNYLRPLISKPKGMMIIFIGPDGSGKTTVSTEILKRFARLPFRKVLYYHGHFHILPNLSEIRSAILNLFGKSSRQDAPVLRDSIGSERNTGVAWLVVLYHFLDYLLGNFFVFYHQIRGDLMVFDRYFYDYLIQKDFIRVPKGLIRFLGNFIPSPNQIYFLKANSEEVYLRKQELHQTEIERQLLACDEIAQRFTQTKTVITSQGAEATSNAVYQAMCEYLIERN